MYLIYAGSGVRIRLAGIHDSAIAVCAETCMTYRLLVWRLQLTLAVVYAGESGP